MIVCSCNYIRDRDIHEAVDSLTVADPTRVLTPVKVYKSIGIRPNCGSCLSHAADIIHKRVACLRNGRRSNVEPLRNGLNGSVIETEEEYQQGMELTRSHRQFSAQVTT